MRQKRRMNATKVLWEIMVVDPDELISPPQNRSGERKRNKEEEKNKREVHCL